MTPTSSKLVRKLTIAVTAAASLTLAVLTPVSTAQDAEPYPDVPAGAYYTPMVGGLGQGGVFDGTLCAEGFCPDEPLDRATMAVWTVRVLDKQDPPAVTSTRFADIETADFHAAFIERFAELGVTQGCGDGTNFCPDDPVRRAQMAVFLSRAFALADGPDPNFGDVADDAWYAPQVAKLAASGITQGCGDGTNFCPDRPTTRAQMATFLGRAIGLVVGPGTEPDDPTEAGHSPISAGERHACAIRADRTLVCWGNDAERQASPPPGEFLSVSAGSFHTCGLRADNTVSCWGDNTDRQLNRPRGEFLSVSAGSRHTCGVTIDHTVRCWGFEGFGLTEPPSGLFNTVSSGGNHSCGLRTDSTIQCWGDSTFGQAGAEDKTGTFACSITGCRFELAPIPGQFLYVSAGYTHTCGITIGDRIECWGDDSAAQSSQLYQSSSLQAAFRSVSAGFQHTCGMTIGDRIECWGASGSGGTVAPDGEFLSVSAGRSFSCGLRPDNSIECWGSDAHNRSTPPTD